MTPTLLPDVPVNEEGYLIEPDHWSEEVARRLAAQESIRLTDRHWAVIRFMRAWYAEHGVAPSPRDIGVFLKRNNWPRSEITALFPYGYVQQACKIAGMKRPRSWSTG
ncbi:MAG: TusE/DsrC/DsvC family sulfur relay protein [Rhodobacterales bacterium]|nr:TusE/DsrC/DsvC family sulfur relay protein [Rhodobacterales bacterium]